MSESEIMGIIEKIKELEDRVSRLEDYKSSNLDKNRKKVSIQEFIRSKSPKNDVQKALTLGYYLEKYDDMPSFNVNDIKQCFKDAREKIPKNVADKIQLNIKKGHIMDFEDRKDGLKAYVLTNSGEKFVENDYEEQ